METNTRPLRAGNSKFHIGRVARDLGKSLCDYCDRKGFDCTVELEEGCDHLVPALFFIPPHIGLDGSFSTFRPSAIWYDRARVLMRTGQPIALLEQGTKNRIGRARLVNAVRGPFWALMEKHAHSNHLMLERPKNEAQSHLERWIRNNMGSRYVKERDAICTVLYLERLK